ncbi:hypothetical protein WJX84_005170 [Apatococcus fuscideae]|uniref:Uncharacterized protein n=1 Tax=Apatococcus fuscideae TaxID=2026836 RepID=A0AAW1RQI1_9CHLO
MARKQQEYRLQELIHADPSAVFQTLTDFTSLRRFVPNIIQTHREGPEGPFVVGSQWQETRNLLFLRGSLHLEVTELQPSRVQLAVR